MPKLSLIEDCFCLTPKWIEDNELRIRKIGDPLNPDRPDINYWFAERETLDKSTMFITVGGSEPQKIGMIDVETSVAWRSYFLCPQCDKKVYKLYLLPNGKEFKCRSCHHGLRYTLTTINKNTPHGRMLYTVTRMNTLSKAREKMGTILYNGKYTKKFESFLRQCDRAGYTKASENAKGLMEAINGFQKV